VDDMRKSAVFLVVLVVLICPDALVSAPTGGDLTAVAKVNISADSLKEILTGVQEVGQLVIHGTEYKAGEVATIFLQLKDANNNPIINGSCYLDIFAPNKTLLYSDVPMLYTAYSDGLYFYDYNLPASTGLYMVSAKCSYSQYIRHYYTLTAGGWNPFEATSCGSNEINISVNSGQLPVGSPIQLNNLMDWAYVYQASPTGGGVKAINDTLLFNATQATCKINKTNTQSLSFYYMGETYNPQTMYFYAWNWNTSLWDNLGSVSTAGKASTTATTGVEDYFSARLNVSGHVNIDGSARIMVYMASGTGFSWWMDWFGIVASTNTTDMVDLKGSGEIHVSGSEGVFEACSVMTDKDRYLPNEAVMLTYFSGSAPSRLKIILLNGSEFYNSGLINGTGIFSYSFSAPDSEQSVMLEVLCGNSFAHKSIVIERGFWDIPFEPLIFLAIGCILVIFALLFFSSRRHD